MDTELDEIVVATSSPAPRDSPFRSTPSDDEQPNKPTPPTTTDSLGIGGKATAKPQQQPTKGNTKGLPKSLQGLESASKDMRADFKDMGYSAKRTRELMGKKETRLPNGHVPRETSQQQEGRARREARGKGGKSDEYEQLRFSENENWVLFDPNRGYTDFIDRTNTFIKHVDPPTCFTHYESFKPGNTRILEFNTETRSVRTRSTPEALRNEGMEVVYTEGGPKLVDVEVEKERRGRGMGRDRLAGRGTRRAVQKEVKIEVESEESELSELDMDTDVDEG